MLLSKLLGDKFAIASAGISPKVKATININSDIMGYIDDLAAILGKTRQSVMEALLLESVVATSTEVNVGRLVNEVPNPRGIYCGYIINTQKITNPEFHNSITNGDPVTIDTKFKILPKSRAFLYQPGFGITDTFEISFDAVSEKYCTDNQEVVTPTIPYSTLVAALGRGLEVLSHISTLSQDDVENIYSIINS